MGYSLHMTDSPVGVLPPISVLLQESWNVFKKTWLHLLVTYIVCMVAYVVITVIALLIALSTGTLSLFSVNNPSFPQILGPALGVLVLDGVLYGIAAIALMLLLSLSWLYIVAANSEKISYGEVIKKSLPMLFPFFVMQLLAFFFYVGGFFLLLLPAWIFMYLFLFSGYVFALEKPGIIGSFKRSIALTTTHFSEVFVRVLLLIGMGILFAIGYSLLSFSFGIFSSLASITSDPSLMIGGAIINAGANIFSSVASVLWSWYALAFQFVLYTHVKNVTPLEKKSSLVGVWITAVVGWVIGLLVIIGIVLLLVSTQSRSPQDMMTEPTAEESIVGPERGV